LIGGLVLLGWLFQIELLKRILPYWISMKANTALAFILAGAALLLYQRASGGRTLERAAQGGAFLIALTGLFTLGEYLFGWDVGIDQLLFREPAGATGTIHPGRMAVPTAIDFVLFGWALFFFRKRNVFLVQIPILIASAIALLGIAGYLYQIEDLQRLGPTPIAPHTALTFLILAGGMLLTDPNTGVMRWVTRADAGAVMLRQLLPAILVIPIAMGWIILEGLRLGLYSIETGWALFAIATVVTLFGFIGRNAIHLHRMDQALRESHAGLERRVAERTAQLEAANRESAEVLDFNQKILAAPSLGIAAYKASGPCVLANQAFARAIHATVEQVLQQDFTQISSWEEYGLLPVAQKALATGNEQREEFFMVTTFGKELWMDCAFIPFSSRGEAHLLLLLDDITGRKRAEEALRASEARQAAALQTGKLAYWEYDFLKDEFTFNDQFYALFHTTAEREGGYTMPAARYAQGFCHPDDVGLVGSEIQKAIETTDPSYSGQLDHRILYAEGGMGYITVRFRIEKDPQGRTVKSYGANQDITERKQVEVALAASEQRYRWLFEHMAEGYAYCRMIYENGQASDWLYLAVNHAFETLTGLKDVAEKRVSEVIPGIRESDPALFDIYARVAQTARPEKFEMFIEALQEWFSISVYSPEPGAFVAVFDIISERKRSEADLEAINARLRRQTQELTLLDEIRTAISRELDLGVILHTVVEAIANTFAYQFVSLYLLQGDRLTLQHQVGYEKTILQIPLGVGVTSRAVLTGRPVLVEDVREDPAFLGAIEGIVSEIAVPLFHRERVVGVLNVESTQGVKLNEHDLNILLALEKDINIAFQRAQFHNEVRANEERFRTSVETLLDGFAILSAVRDEDGQIIDFCYEYINDAGCYLNGKSREEHLGHSLQKLRPGHAQGSLLAEAAQLVESGQPISKEEFQYDEPPGAGQKPRRVFDVRAVKLGDGMALTWRDVTERRQMELAEHEQRVLAEALADTAAALTATMHLDDVFDRILGNVGRVVPHENANIMLIEEGVARIVGCYGYAEADLERARALRLPVAQTPNLIGMGETGQPLIIPDTRTYAGWVDFPETRWIRSYAGAPVQVKGKTVGFINLNAAVPGFFQEDHARRLQAFANQAAIAIENAQLYAQTQQLAITDELTGLYNRRGFFELGRREVERAVRFGHPLSLLILDIDHFKTINDTYGHPAGDRVLQTLARRCLANIREIDLLGRYGGEEFVILLPESSLANASQVAERLRKVIAGEPFASQAGSLEITISLGVASVGEGEGDLADLIARADRALYLAKRSGRNRVASLGET
jgi:diguanylate cyclase (GGDEF)-like protein/PAS domain S-box-containing protein